MKIGRFNGSFKSILIFDYENEAKEYLKQVALNYYDEYDMQALEHIETIILSNYLTIGSVTAFVKDLFKEE